MFGVNYPNEYERLRALATAYRGKRITKQWFVRGIHWIFADDGGMDWCDDFNSLNHLAFVISISPAMHKQVEPQVKGEST